MSNPSCTSFRVLLSNSYHIDLYESTKRLHKERLLTNLLDGIPDTISLHQLLLPLCLLLLSVILGGLELGCGGATATLTPREGRRVLRLLHL